jgi:hypothetical protein
MFARADKSSENLVKIGIKLVANKEFQLARRMMTKAGISPDVIHRILYEPTNIRTTDKTK